LQLLYEDSDDWIHWERPQRIISPRRKYQEIVKLRYDQTEFVLFAPGAIAIDPGAGNPTFKHHLARINSAFGSPLREFPSRAILNGLSLVNANLRLVNLQAVRLDFAGLSQSALVNADLSYANLSHAYLEWTDLNGANLYRARLDGANLQYAHNLTRQQIESAWIDGGTILPKGLEEVKSRILERQQLREKEILERQLSEKESLERQRLRVESIDEDVIFDDDISF